MLNMFKVNNKDTRTMPLTYLHLCSYFAPCSSVSTIKFENVIDGWGWLKLDMINNISGSGWYIDMNWLLEYINPLTTNAPIIETSLLICSLLRKSTDLFLYDGNISH